MTQILNLYPSITPRTFLAQVQRNLVLFFRVPVDFILTFGDPLDKVSDLKKVNHNAHNLGQKLLKELKNHLSDGMKIYFVGSNFFQIPGINDDIDLLAEYTTEDEKQKWKQIFSGYFGQPVLERAKFIKWETVYQGYPVEVLLSNPKSRLFRKMFDAYNALRTDSEILVAYEALKRNSVGVSLREYNRRQLYFFDYIVKTKLQFRK